METQICKRRKIRGRRKDPKHVYKFETQNNVIIINLFNEMTTVTADNSLVCALKPGVQRKTEGVILVRSQLNL